MCLSCGLYRNCLQSVTVYYTYISVNLITSLYVFISHYLLFVLQLRGVFIRSYELDVLFCCSVDCWETFCLGAALTLVARRAMT
jgi:hypothetical protein